MGAIAPPPFLGIGVRKILEVIGLFMYTVVNSAVYTIHILCIRIHDWLS